MSTLVTSNLFTFPDIFFNKSLCSKTEGSGVLSPKTIIFCSEGTSLKTLIIFFTVNGEQKINFGFEIFIAWISSSENNIIYHSIPKEIVLTSIFN